MIVDLDGISASLEEHAVMRGVNIFTVRARIRKGMTPAAALTAPVRLRRSSAAARVTMICPGCGCEYRRSPKNPGRKTCSVRCGRAVRGNRSSASSRNRAVRRCSNCGVATWADGHHSCVEALTVQAPRACGALAWGG